MSGLTGSSFPRSKESAVTGLLRWSVSVCGLLVAVTFWTAAVPAQPSPAKSKAKSKPISPAELKKLDSRLEEVQRTFLKDTDSIIRGYEEGGQYDRAKILLEVLLKLDPKNEVIKKKLEQLDDMILDSSESEMELDASKGWQQVGLVTKDRLIRIEVEGDYRFVASLPATADGFPTKDPANDMAGAPLGSVVAIILPPTGAGGGGGGRDGGNAQRQPTPFFVGAKFEQQVQRDGMLLLKVNVPPGSKCTGKLKVKLGGVTRSS